MLQQGCGVAVRYQRRSLLDKKMSTKNFCHSDKNLYWDFPFECRPVVFPLVHKIYISFFHSHFEFSYLRPIDHDPDHRLRRAQTCKSFTQSDISDKGYGDLAKFVRRFRPDRTPILTSYFAFSKRLFISGLRVGGEGEIWDNAAGV